VLGEAAPYTQFTAATSGSRADTGNFPRVETRPATDLHAEPTRILSRSQVSSPAERPELPEFPPLGELSTQILDRGRLHEQPTAIKAIPVDPRHPAGEEPGDLHAQQTQILKRPDGAPPAPAPLAALDTRIIVGDADTGQPTELHGSIDTERHPRVSLDEDGTDVTTERAPEPKPADAAARQPRGFGESEESTAVPLGDEDVDPDSDA
ncbi:MAG: hypothetical protein ACRETD_13280, partial [Steroidobacteraceae bacterium]